MDDPMTSQEAATSTGSIPSSAAQPDRHPPCIVSDSAWASGAGENALKTASLQARTVTMASRSDGCAAHQARSRGRSHRSAAPRIAVSLRWLKVARSARSIPTPAERRELPALPAYATEPSRLPSVSMIAV
jgi:hypothetical protein